MKINIAFFTAMFFFSTTAIAQYRLYESGIRKYNAKDYYEAISLLSDFLIKPHREKKFDVDAYYWRGLAAFKLNNFAEAGEDLKKALELNYRNKGNLHWFLAICYNKIGAKEEALVQYDNALNLLGSDKTKQSQILFDRSQVYAKAGLKNQAPVKTFQIMLIDSTGKQIRSIDSQKRDNLIDIKDIPKGDYVLMVVFENQIHNYRIVNQ